MAEQDDQTGGRYHDTNDPAHPRELVLTHAVGRTALWSWLGPLIALSVLMSLLLLYWSIRAPGATEDQRRDPIVGTSGYTGPGEKYGDYRKDGGGDPSPRPKDTESQLENRGAGSQGSGLSGVKQ